MHKLVCRHTHTHPHKRTYTLGCRNRHTFIHTHTHTQTCTYTLVYTHTHTHAIVHRNTNKHAQTHSAHTPKHTQATLSVRLAVSRSLVMLCVCPPRRVTGLQGVGSGGGRASLGAPEVSLLHQSFSSGKLCINQRWGPPGDRGRVR